jgi:hypothetical protein
MQRSEHIYQKGRALAALLMITALLWLTVSAPFVYAAQQASMQLSTLNHSKGSGGDSESAGLNPFANTTEERPESGSNTLSEYLHDIHLHLQYDDVPEEHHKCHPSDLYYAFHPELNSPPPEA